MLDPPRAVFRELREGLDRRQPSQLERLSVLAMYALLVPVAAAANLFRRFRPERPEQFRRPEGLAWQK